MEETNQADANQSNAPQEENKIIHVNKDKLYLFAALIAVFILTGIVFYMFWENHFKDKAVKNDDTQQEEQAGNRDDLSTEEFGGEEMFDLFSDKYLTFAGPSLLSDSSSESSPSSEKSGSSNNKNENNPTGKEIKWKTYINKDIGYMLKYPSDWKLEETSEYHEILQGNVKNITIYTSDEKYFLSWGIKENADPFFISGRTGVGAGEPVKSGKMTVLDTEIDIVKLMLDGKVTEYFFNGIGSFKTKDGSHECNASFSYNSDKVSGNPNLANLAEFETAKKILQTVEIIPRSGKICQSEMTAQDKDIINGWAAFYNKTYDYVVQIPNDWTKSNVVSYEKMNPDKVVTYINEKDKYERFQIRSEEYAWFDIPKSWTKFASKKMKVACFDSNLWYYERGDMVFLTAYFKHDDKRFSVFYGFKSPGASITSNAIKMYEAMLKSINFGK